MVGRKTNPRPSETPAIAAGVLDTELGVWCRTTALTLRCSELVARRWRFGGQPFTSNHVETIVRRRARAPSHTLMVTAGPVPPLGEVEGGSPYPSSVKDSACPPGKAVAKKQRTPGIRGEYTIPVNERPEGTSSLGECSFGAICTIISF
jgi:hypothetical protein